MRRLLTLAAAVLVGGCGGPAEKKTSLPLAEVPENVLKVAKEKLPGVTFDQAFREPNGAIELRGKDKRGKVREVDVMPDGTVTEVE